MRTRSLAVAVAILAVSRVAVAQTSAEAWTTDVLVERALAAHPAIGAAAAEVRRAEGEARQAGLWPNPRLDYAAENLRRGGGPSRAEHTVRVEQPLLLGGKLRLSREALQHATEAAAAGMDAVRQTVTNAVRLRAVEVRLAEARVGLGRRVVAYAEDAEDIARQLFNTGLVDQPDVLRAEAEAEAMRVRLAVADSAREQAWQQLALAVGDPALPRRPLADEPVDGLQRDATLAALLAGHPALAAGRAGIAQARRAVDRAGADRVPDLILSAGPRYSSERSTATGQVVGWEPVAGVGMSLPLWNRNQGGVAAATAVELGAGSAQAARELAIQTRFEDLWQRYTAASLTAGAYGRASSRRRSPPTRCRWRVIARWR